MTYGEADLQTVKQNIKAEAARLGFPLCGITNLDSPPHFPEYQKWLQAGRHGTMQYLARPDAVEKRAHPERVMPGAKSVVVLGFPYPSPGSALLPIERVASYAWGQDYHIVIPALLKKLVLFIESQVNEPVAYRAYTDTGPILERDLAQRAGIRWIGKNTCLINPLHGSYFFLAEIFLALELPPDSPFEADRCGTCTCCIQACPTHCILPDRTIDANRCISYLTIEHKGPIPVDLRSKVGDWIFGCDICQDVCPWNLRFATGHLEAVNKKVDQASLSGITGELSLTPEEFSLKYKESPIIRSRREGFLRNILVALGNSHSSEAVEPVINILINEENSLLRGQAAWTLGQIATAVAIAALIARQEVESDPEVLAEISSALLPHKDG